MSERYMRVSEMMIDVHMQGLLRAMRGDDGCTAYNSAVALSSVFRFAARDSSDDRTLFPHDWKNLADIAEDKNIDGSARGRLLYSMQEIPSEPVEARAAFRAALSRLIDSANAALAAIHLSRQWKLFRRRHRTALLQVLSNANTMEGVDFDDIIDDTPVLFDELRMSKAQIAETAALLGSSDYTTRYLSGSCLRIIGERARPHLPEIRAAREKDLDDPVADLMGEILAGLGEPCGDETRDAKKASA